MMRPRWLLVAAALLTLTLTTAVVYFRAQIDFTDLSLAQLTAAGYYAYVLPDSYTEAVGWQRTISLRFGFDWQCRDFLSSEHWNPLEIGYRDQAGKRIFELDISPKDAIFDPARATDVVTVNADWIPTRRGIAYPASDGTVLEVRDAAGMDVVFSSWMRRADLLTLISRLRYVGGNQAQVGSPWSRDRC